MSAAAMQLWKHGDGSLEAEQKAQERADWQEFAVMR